MINLTRRPNAGARRASAVALLGLCSMVAGCASSGDAADTEGAATSHPQTLSSVILHVGDISSIQKLVLAKSGALEGAPYKVDLIEFATGPSEYSGLQNGTLDLGFSGDTAAIFAYSGGMDFKVISTLPARPQNVGIVVPAGSSVTDVAGLAGKQVAVTFGTSTDYLLDRALDSAGLSAQDVTRKNLTPALAVAAVNSGQVDAAVLQQPFVALQQQAGARLLTDGEGLMRGHAFSVASKHALGNDMTVRAIGDYLQRLSKAFGWAKRHPQEWARAVSDLYHLPVATAKALTSNFSDWLQPIEDGVVSATQDQADAFHDLHELTAPVDVSNMFDDRFNGLLRRLSR